MTWIQRYLKGFRVQDDLEAGLFEKPDGTVWLRNPDGTETQVGSGGGSQPVSVASLTLTSEQVLALADTPVTVVAAPGAGKLIYPSDAIYVVKAGATPYTAHGGNIILGVETTDGLQTWATQGAADFLDSPTDLAFNQGYTQQALLSHDPATFADLALTIRVANGGTNPTDGDGELFVWVPYYIVTLP